MLCEITSLRFVVGQVLGLRRPHRPPGAGPRVLLGSCGETGCDRVALNVPLDAPELIAVADQMVIALVLPKRLAGPMEQKVGAFSGGGFE